MSRPARSFVQTLRTAPSPRPHTVSRQHSTVHEAHKQIHKSSSCPVIGVRRAWQSTRLSPVRAKKSESDKLGDDFMEELSTMKFRYQKPTNAQRSALEIGWKLNSAQKQAPKTCSGCKSDGSIECRFCHGTGVMQLGDTLYCSNSGCSVCPVCEGMGQVECKSCRGSGYLAWWMPDPEPEGIDENGDDR